jgi:hypothetical protein
MSQREQVVVVKDLTKPERKVLGIVAAGLFLWWLSKKRGRP